MSEPNKPTQTQDKTVASHHRVSSRPKSSESDVKVTVHATHDECEGATIVNTSISDGGKEYRLGMRILGLTQLEATQPYGDIDVYPNFRTNPCYHPIPRMRAGLQRPKGSSSKTIVVSPIQPSTGQDRGDTSSLQEVRSEDDVKNDESTSKIPNDHNRPLTKYQKIAHNLSFAYYQLLTKNPYKIIGVISFIYFLMFAITSVLFAVSYPKCPFQFKGIPLELRGYDVYTKSKILAAVLRDESISRFDPFKSKLTQRFTNINVLVETYQGAAKDHFADVIINTDSDNILTKHFLLMSERLEKNLTRQLTHFCANNCTLLPYSIVRFFDGSFIDRDAVFYDPYFNYIAKIINRAQKYKETRYLIQPLLSNDAHVHPRFISASRMFISFHGKDMRVPQRWFHSLDLLNENGYEKLKLRVWSWRYYLQTIFKRILDDSKLPIFGITVFIILFLVKTSSVWLTFFGILNILFCYVTANLIYTVVFRFRYFGIYQALSFFVLLKLTASDFFILNDAWRINNMSAYLSKSQILSDCLKFGLGSSLLTSFAMFLSCIPSVFSPILVVSSCSVFLITLILIHLLSVTLFYPSIIVLHSLHLCNFYEEMCSGNKYCHKLCAECNWNKKLSAKWLSKYLHKALNNAWIVIAIFVVSLAFTCTSIYFIATTAVESRYPQYLRQSEKIERFHDIRRAGFLKPEPNVGTNLFIIWGVKQELRDSCGAKEYSLECDRRATYESFSINPPSVQKNILDFCKKLHLMGDFRIRTHPTEGHREIYCFPYQINDILKNYSLSLPVTAAKLKIIRQKLNSAQNSSKISNQNPSHVMEDMTHLWQNDIRFDKRYYRNTFATFKTPKENNIIDTVKRFAYVAIKVKLDIHPMLDNYKDGLAMYKRWENFIQNEVFWSKEQVFQATESAWHWFSLLHTLYSQLLIFISVGFCAVLVFICVWFHHDLVVGLVAALCILCVVVGALGVACMVSDRFGVIDSINASTVVVALSLDYILQIAFAYSLADKKDGEACIEYILTTMANPVISSACTFLVTSFFLLFSRVQIIWNFGVMLFACSVLCLVYAVVLMPVLLVLIDHVFHNEPKLVSKDSSERVNVKNRRNEKKGKSLLNSDAVAQKRYPLKQQRSEVEQRSTTEKVSTFPLNKTLDDDNHGSREKVKIALKIKAEHHGSDSTIIPNETHEPDQSKLHKQRGHRYPSAKSENLISTGSLKVYPAEHIYSTPKKQTDINKTSDIPPQLKYSNLDRKQGERLYENYPAIVEPPRTSSTIEQTFRGSPMYGPYSQTPVTGLGTSDGSRSIAGLFAKRSSEFILDSDMRTIPEVSSINERSHAHVDDPSGNVSKEFKDPSELKRSEVLYYPSMEEVLSIINEPLSPLSLLSHKSSELLRSSNLKSAAALLPSQDIQLPAEPKRKRSILKCSSQQRRVSNEPSVHSPSTVSSEKYPIPISHTEQRTSQISHLRDSEIFDDDHRSSVLCMNTLDIESPDTKSELKKIDDNSRLLDHQLGNSLSTFENILGQEDSRPTRPRSPGDFEYNKSLMSSATASEPVFTTTVPDNTHSQTSLNRWMKQFTRKKAFKSFRSVDRLYKLFRRKPSKISDESPTSPQQKI